MALTSCLLKPEIPFHGCRDDNVMFESSEHGKSLLAGLQHLRQMQLLCDVVLVAEDKEFPAHRVVLASCSDYFRAMFTDGLRECSESRIILNGLSASSIAHLLDFAYNSTISIDSDNVVDVLSGATFVQILPVVAACENFLRDHLSIDNCLNTAAIAELFSMHHLQQHAFSFICRHWTLVSSDNDFSQLSAQFLMCLLSSGYPVDCREYDVLMGVLRWFSFSPLERCCHIMNILSCIMVQNISDEELQKILSSNDWSQLCKVFPDYITCVSNLDVASKCEKFSSCVEERQSVLNVAENILDKESAATKCELSKQVRGSHQFTSQPQGVPNLRGFHSTIVVAGGFHKEAGMTNNLMYMDTHSGKLKYLTKVPHLDQINFGLTTFRNQLFVIGGCFNDHMQEIAHPFGFRFNPSTNKWTSIAPMLQERCRFLLCATSDRIYAIGGDPFASDVGLNDVSPCEVYDPLADDWKSIMSLPGNRAQLAGTSYGEYLVVSGGIQENEERVFDDFYLYNPVEDLWERKADMLSPRADHSMFVWDNCVYVIGGWHLHSVSRKRIMATSIDCYDLRTDSWKVVGTVESPRTFGTYTLANDRIYAVGGWTNGNRLHKCRTIDFFDLRNNVWIIGHEQNIALWEHCACSIYIPKYAPTKS